MTASQISTSVTYKVIAAFPYYRVGDDGSVWSRFTSDKRRAKKLTVDGWFRLKPTPQYRGHLVVCMVRDGKKYYRHVHRLVLEAFVCPRPPGLECCHDPDPDPANNRLENLRWGTRKANCADRRDQRTDARSRTARGERDGAAKLYFWDVLYIVEAVSVGVARHDVASYFGVSKATIDAILGGYAWNHVTGIPRPCRSPGPRSLRPRLADAAVLALVAESGRGVSRAALARKYGVTLVTVSRLLNGESRGALTGRKRNAAAQAT